jgi:hypothetical protein
LLVRAICIWSYCYEVFQLYLNLESFVCLKVCPAFWCPATTLICKYLCHYVLQILHSIDIRKFYMSFKKSKLLQRIVLLRTFRFRHCVVYKSLPGSGFRWQSCNTNFPPQAPIQYNNSWHIPGLYNMRSCALRSSTQSSQLLLLKATPPNYINLTDCHGDSALALGLYSNDSSTRFPVRIGRSYQSQWPRGLRRGSTAVRLLGLWVRIPPGAWMSVSCGVVCCQVEVSASGWSLVQRSPTGWCVCVYVCHWVWSGAYNA